MRVAMLIGLCAILAAGSVAALAEPWSETGFFRDVEFSATTGSVVSGVLAFRPREQGAGDTTLVIELMDGALVAIRVEVLTHPILRTTSRISAGEWWLEVESLYEEFGGAELSELISETMERGEGSDAVVWLRTSEGLVGTRAYSLGRDQSASELAALREIVTEETLPAYVPDELEGVLVAVWELLGPRWGATDWELGMGWVLTRLTGPVFAEEGRPRAEWTLELGPPRRSEAELESTTLEVLGAGRRAGLVDGE